MTVDRTTPYAWPYHDALCGERLALVIAGADADWASRVQRSHEHLLFLRGLANEIAVLGGLVVRVGHPGRLRDPAPLLDLRAQVDVRAGGIDGFYASALDSVLRGARRSLLVFAGFGLEGPVHSTLRSANDRGYECLTLRDGCAVLDPECEHASYSSIEMSGGIFGAVGDSAALLHALHQTVPLEVE
jgi:Isochorismatase family